MSVEECERRQEERRRIRSEEEGKEEEGGPASKGKDTGTEWTTRQSAMDWKTNMDKQAVDTETKSSTATKSPGVLPSFVPTAALTKDLKVIMILVGVMLAAVLERWVRNWWKCGMRRRVGAEEENSRREREDNSMEEGRWEEVDRLAADLFETVRAQDGDFLKVRN